MLQAQSPEQLGPSPGHRDLSLSWSLTTALPRPDPHGRRKEGLRRKEGKEGEGEGWRRRQGGSKGGRTKERSEQEDGSEEEAVQLHRALGLTRP